MCVQRSFCDSGNIECILAVHSGLHFNYILGLAVDHILFLDSERVVIEIRQAAEMVVGKIRPEERVVLRTCDNRTCDSAHSIINHLVVIILVAWTDIVKVFEKNRRPRAQTESDFQFHEIML
jgi:hypothetical protein